MRAVALLCPARLLAVAAAAVLAGCARENAPVAPSGVEPVESGTLAAKNNNKVRLVALNLAATTLAIGGPATSYTVTLENRAKQLATGLGVQASLVQGTVIAQAGGTAVNCPPAPAGNLEKGSCAFSFSTSASNTTVEGGLLAPGPATFVLRLLQAQDGTTTEIGSESVAVTLVANEPYIERVSLEDLASPVSIWFGRTTDYTIRLQNPTGSTITGTLIQAEYVQVRNGTTYLGGGGGGPVECSPGVFDQLTPGTCVMPFNTTPNTSTGLAEGLATLNVRLYVGDVLKSTRSVTVYLSFPIG